MAHAREARAATARRLPAAPKGLPMVGHAVKLWRQPLQFLCSLTDRGDLVEVKIGRQKALVVCDPDLMQQVLHDGRTFDKGGHFYDRVREVAGDGLGTSMHEPHRRQRRLIQPAFQADRLVECAKDAVSYTAEVTGAWRDGQVIDVIEAMDTITCKVTAKMLFGACLPSAKETAAILGWLEDLNEWMQQRTVTPSWLDWVPIPGNRRFDRALASLDAFIYGSIQTYRDEGIDQGDMLSVLTTARGDNGDALSDREIRNHIITFIIGGTETVSSLVDWTMHLLAVHPAMARRVHTEVDTVCDGRLPVPADVARFDYIQRFLAEALRVYPPAWLVSRVVTRDTHLAGYFLPAGISVLCSPYVLHHRPDLYPDPEDFDPDRWLPDHAATIPRGSHIPFGSGPRKCIGDKFALLEAPLMLATITLRWRLEHLPGQTTYPPSVRRVGLRPAQLRMRVRQRHPVQNA
ncbi:cytochrome P450 [Streptomyces sp. NPDC006733]|uniref:cytochrome P450 n=1 Tax=Streptomyces sp. NPDC006733 TaxID=3155460 RepID=UPI0033EB5B3B